MAGSDTVAKYRRSIATRMEWTLRTNQPDERRREATEAIGGRTLLRNVPAASRQSPLSKPRVLREAGSELAELERAAGASYPEMLARLERRYRTTTLGSVFASAHLDDDWANVPKSDAQPALAAFRDAAGGRPMGARSNGFLGRDIDEWHAMPTAYRRSGRDSAGTGASMHVPTRRSVAGGRFRGRGDD